MSGPGAPRNHGDTPIVDDEGNTFVTKAYRYFVPVVVGTPLAYPCDAILIVGAAGTVQTMTAIGSEMRSADAEEAVPFTLACNVWHEMALAEVTVLGGGNAIAGYIRRPQGA